MLDIPDAHPALLFSATTKDIDSTAKVAKFFNHHQRFQEKIPIVASTENMDSLKPPKKKKLKLDTIVTNNSSNSNNSGKLDGRRRSSGGGGGDNNNVPKPSNYKKDSNCDSNNGGQDNQENKEPPSSPTSPPSSKPSTPPKTSQQSSTKRKQTAEPTESTGPTKDSNPNPNPSVSSSNHSISSITNTITTTNSTSPTANAQSTPATTVGDSNNGGNGGGSFYPAGGDAPQQHPAHHNAITMANAYFQTMNFNNNSNSNNSPHAPPHAYMNAVSHASSPHQQQQFQSHHYQAAMQHQQQQRQQQQQQLQQRSAFIGSTMGSNNGMQSGCGDKSRSTDFSINAIIGSNNHQHHVHPNNNNSNISPQRHSGLLQRPSPQPALTAETATTAALAAAAANTTNTSQPQLAKGILNLSVSSTPSSMAQYTAMMPHHQLQSPTTSPLLSPGLAELNHHPHPHHLQHPHHLHSPEINQSKSSNNKAIDPFMLSSQAVANNPMLPQHFHALAAAAAAAAAHPHQPHPMNNLNHLNNHHHPHHHQIRAPSLSPSTASSMDSGDLVNGQLNVNNSNNAHNSGNHHHHNNNHHPNNNKNQNNNHHQQQHNLAIVVDSPRSVSCRSPSPAPSSTSSSNSKEVSSSPRNNHCSTNAGSGGNNGGKDRSNSRNSNNGSPTSSSTTTSTSMANNPYASELKPKFNCEDLAKVDCHLENKELWDKFHELGTEMIITKTGRRMFPTLRCSFSGIESCLQMLNHCGGTGQDVRFLVMMDIVPVDNKRYRYAYHRSSWLVAGKADPPSQTRLYLHPDAPYTLEQLRKQVISFEKVKLTNNEMDKSGHIVLNSMHRYQPRVHLIIRKNPQYFNAPVLDIEHELHRTFIFPETVFTAVTAYQNQLITKLKIDSNPFAKGFRDSSRLTDLERETMETLMTEPYAGCRPFFAPPFGLSPFGCLPASYADLSDPRVVAFIRDRAAMFGINPALMTPHMMLPNGFTGAALPPPSHQSLPPGADGSQFPHIFGSNQMFWPPPPPPPPPPSSNPSEGKQQTPPTGQTPPSTQQSIPSMSNGAGGGPNMDQLNQFYLQNPWYAILATGVRGPPPNSGPPPTSAATAPNNLAHLVSNPEFWAAVANYGNTATSGAPLGPMGPINTKPTQMLMSIPSPEAFMKPANHTATAGAVNDEPNTPTNMELSPDSKGNMASGKGADSSPASANNAAQVNTTEAVA